MIRDDLIRFASLFLFLATASAQEATAVIHIKLINGLNGRPWKFVDFEGEFALPDHRQIKVKTDERGVATLQVPVDATIYTHNTKLYVACADEAGGLIHNDFKVRHIIAFGAVQAVAQPNQCRVTNSAPVPGELVIFVRPWKFLEDNPL